MAEAGKYDGWTWYWRCKIKYNSSLHGSHSPLERKTCK
jgi:hypothetical protein